MEYQEQQGQFNNQNQTPPNMEPVNNSAPTPPKKDGRVGPLIGTIIIIIIIIMGGMYFWGSTVEEKRSEENSSRMSEISNELENININDLDNELTEIENEIDKSLEE